MEGMGLWDTIRINKEALGDKGVALLAYLAHGPQSSPIGIIELSTERSVADVGIDPAPVMEWMHREGLAFYDPVKRHAVVHPIIYDQWAWIGKQPVSKVYSIYRSIDGSSATGFWFDTYGVRLGWKPKMRSSMAVIKPVAAPPSYIKKAFSIDDIVQDADLMYMAKRTGVDLVQEAHKMAMWVRVHPGRKLTRAFCYRWMLRSQKAPRAAERSESTWAKMKKLEDAIRRVNNVGE